MTIWNVLHKKKKKHLIYLELLPGFSFMFITKSAGVIFNHRHKIHDVVTRLEKLFPSTRKDQESNKISWLCMDLKRKSLVFIFLNMGGVSVYIVTPLITQFYDVYFLGKPFESLLPTPMWLWFDHTRRGAYEISYFLISWSSYQLGFTLLVTDLLCCSMLCVVSMEFRDIAQKIQRKVKLKDEISLQELKIQLKNHQELIAITDMIETIFAPSLLIR